MLRIILVLLTLLSIFGLHAQQTLTPRVAVYNVDGERFVVDSVRFTDSMLVLTVGELSFEIDEERFARLEPISGVSFSTLDQIYSFSLKSGKTIVGQVIKYKQGEILVRTSDDRAMTIRRDELQGLHREKRNVFEKPWVKECATTNFFSSPYALKGGDVVFSSFIYGNSLEVGLGEGFSARLLTSPIPVVFPTGYGFLYKKRIEHSDFSVGMSLGQFWLGPLRNFFNEGTANSGRNFVTLIAPSVTYHYKNSFLKTGVTIFSGSSLFARRNTFAVTSTLSIPGVNRPQNRWNLTLNLMESNEEDNFNPRSFLLAGYQNHGPKGSYTLGVGLVRNESVVLIPFPYACFSLYSSKEQKRVSSAYNMHRRMKFVKRTVAMERSREQQRRKREALKERRRQRQN
ncbi:MAG: hypothetical protein AB8F78_09920 [Saprospiraceae bacterium]